MIKRAILLVVVALAGCGGGEHEDIKKWMADATKGMTGKVEKIEEPKDRKSTRLNSSHLRLSRMPSSA